METTEKKKAAPKDYIMIIFGVLAMLISCAFFAGSVALDVTGEQAIGKLSNAAFGDCPPNKSCWTSRVDFTSKDGEQITFYPMTFPMFFDFDPFLSGRPYEEYSNFQVRYFAQFPQVAKVKLAFFLEYVNMFCGLGIGAFILFLSYVFSAFGKNKTIVLDLSKYRKGNK